MNLNEVMALMTRKTPESIKSLRESLKLLSYSDMTDLYRENLRMDATYYSIPAHRRIKGRDTIH